METQFSDHPASSDYTSPAKSEQLTYLSWTILFCTLIAAFELANPATANEMKASESSEQSL